MTFDTFMRSADVAAPIYRRAAMPLHDFFRTIFITLIHEELAADIMRCTSILRTIYRLRAKLILAEEIAEHDAATIRRRHQERWSDFDATPARGRKQHMMPLRPRRHKLSLSFLTFSRATSYKRGGYVDAIRQRHCRQNYRHYAAQYFVLVIRRFDHRIFQMPLLYFQ